MRRYIKIVDSWNWKERLWNRAMYGESIPFTAVSKQAGCRHKSCFCWALRVPALMTGRCVAPRSFGRNRLLMSRAGSSTTGLRLAWNSLGCGLCFFTLLGDIKHWAAAARSLQAQEPCLVANTEDRGELKQRHIFVALGWPLACQPATHMDLPQLQSVILVLMGDEGYWAMIRPAA